MRKFAIATLGLALIGSASAARAATIENTCAASVKSLTDDWDAIAFPTPMKLAQARVVGRNGVESTGGQVNYMRNQIRTAVNDCQAGREDAAKSRITIVREMLPQPGVDAALGVASRKRGGDIEGFSGSSVDPAAIGPANGRR